MTTDGLKVCETCGEPKECMKEFPRPNGIGTFSKIVPIRCRCELDAESERTAKDQKKEFDHHMTELQARFGLSDGNYETWTFAADDRRNAKLSDICKRYVDKWPEIEQNGLGILFWGTPGTGKSFYAGAIVNALLDRQIPALVTNFPRLLNILQAARDRQEYIDALKKYRLLVVDDLGVERESSYSAEQVYSVIDARYRSGLPLIVTTNMTLEELKTPASMQYKRIYDRILELCPVHLKMIGESRRTGRTEERKKLAKELLTGG